MIYTFIHSANVPASLRCKNFLFPECSVFPFYCHSGGAWSSPQPTHVSRWDVDKAKSSKSSSNEMEMFSVEVLLTLIFLLGLVFIGYLMIFNGVKSHDWRLSPRRGRAVESCSEHHQCKMEVHMWNTLNSHVSHLYLCLLWFIPLSRMSNTIEHNYILIYIILIVN